MFYQSDHSHLKLYAGVRHWSSTKAPKERTPNLGRSSCWNPQHRMSGRFQIFAAENVEENALLAHNLHLRGDAVIKCSSPSCTSQRQVDRPSCSRHSLYRKVRLLPGVVLITFLRMYLKVCLTNCERSCFVGLQACAAHCRLLPEL